MTVGYGMTLDIRQVEISKLRNRIRELELEVELLRKENATLRRVSPFDQGRKAELFVAALADGSLSGGFADPFDVLTRSGQRLEVKYSQLMVQKHTRTKRWNWSKPEGWRDRGKEYDFLVLVGEKDPRYAAQYPTDLEHVLFLIPRANVKSVTSRGSAIGANICLNTNLATALSQRAYALKKFLVPSKAWFQARMLNAAVP